LCDFIFVNSSIQRGYGQIILSKRLLGVKKESPRIWSRGLSFVVYSMIAQWA
jgi:hypothetical protein